MASRLITAESGHGANVGGDNTLKVQLARESDGQIWDAVGLNLEAFVLAQLTRYDIALTESAAGSGIYSYTIPATLPAGTYRERPRFTDGSYLASREPFKWNGTSTVGEVTGSGYLSVGECLQILQTSARNAGQNATWNGNPYRLADGHLAVKSAMRHFIRETKCTRQVDDVALAEDAYTLDLSAVAGFHPERVLEVWSTADDTDSTVQLPPITLGSYSEILRARSITVPDAPPLQIGFSNATQAICDSNADQDYTIHFRWYTPLIDWTVGDSSSDTSNTLVNVPADLADFVMRTAGVCFLQSNQPQQQKEGIIARLWGEYVDHYRRHRGDGAVEGKTLQLKTLRQIRAERRG